jgi:hypothetical protein
VIAEPEQTVASNAFDKIGVAELLGYVGAAVAVFALFPLILKSTEAPTKWMVLLAGMLAAALLAVMGAVFGRGIDARLARLRSVLWFLSAQAFFGALVAVLTANAASGSKGILALSELITAIYAGALWWLHRGSLQQIAVYVTAVGALLTILSPSFDEVTFAPPDFTPLMIVALVAGAVWMVLGWRGVVSPRRTALVLGAISMSFAPYFLTVSGDTNGAGILFLVVGAILLMAGHLLSDRAVSGIGVADLLIGSITVLAYALDGSRGAAAGALFIGLGLLLVAIVLIGTPRTTGSPPAVSTQPAPPMPPTPPQA